MTKTLKNVFDGTEAQHLRRITRIPVTQLITAGLAIDELKKVKSIKSAHGTPYGFCFVNIIVHIGRWLFVSEADDMAT